MKKKSRVQSFKNWLLARDAASRISTKSTYTSFLESSNNSEIDPKFAMSVFDSITNSDYFYKFQNNFADLGIWKMTGNDAPKRMQLSLTKKYFSSNVQKFISLLGVSEYSFPDQMEVLFDPAINGLLKGPDKKTVASNFLIFSFLIKPTKNEEEIKEISKLLIKDITISIDFGNPYKNNFFNFWVEKSVFEGSKWDHFPQTFESAFVEWLRVAPKEERAKAYFELVKNLTKWDKEIIDHVNWGIKEFNLDIPDKEDTDAGIGIIKRFGGF